MLAQVEVFHEKAAFKIYYFVALCVDLDLRGLVQRAETRVPKWPFTRAAKKTIVGETTDLGENTKFQLVKPDAQLSIS